MNLVRRVGVDGARNRETDSGPREPLTVLTPGLNIGTVLLYGQGSVTEMSVEISYTRARARFADLLDRAVENRETLIITRHGVPSAALISATELKSLEETAHLLRSPANARRLLEALQRALRGRPRPQSVASLRRGVRVGRRG